MAITYHITNMRAVRPSRKVAEKNPERWRTVHGTFHDAEGNKLSIGSKNVDREDALSPEFYISVADGILTMPEGKRGRRATAGDSDADILADLEALRNPVAEPDTEPVAEPVSTSKRSK